MNVHMYLNTIRRNVSKQNIMPGGQGGASISGSYACVFLFHQIANLSKHK